MYSLACYDFKTRQNWIVNIGSLENMLLLAESLLCDYILAKQGDSYGTDLKDFLYKYGHSPDRSRSMDKGPYYVEMDLYDPYKYVIKEKRKIYGYIYNSFSYINHIELLIVRMGPIQTVIDSYNNEYTYAVPFKEVLNELLSNNSNDSNEMEIVDIKYLFN